MRYLRYRKKSVEVEAMRYGLSSFMEICAWAREHGIKSERDGGHPSTSMTDSIRLAALGQTLTPNDRAAFDSTRLATYDGTIGPKDLARRRAEAFTGTEAWTTHMGDGRVAWALDTGGHWFTGEAPSHSAAYRTLANHLQDLEDAAIKVMRHA